MSVRAGSEPRNMTTKLLGCQTDDGSEAKRIDVAVDQVALTSPKEPELLASLATLERSPELDLVVAYDPFGVRDRQAYRPEADWQESLRRLGILRGRPGIGFPSSVHLERFGAPGRILVTDDPRMALLGGIGVLPLITTTARVLETITTGRFPWTLPRVVQILLSGRLNATVSARDVCLELLRRGLKAQIQALSSSSKAEVVLEFTGTGLRGLTVHERAMLCSIAPDVGAAAAITGSDEKTELYLRDQRRSKAQRQLTPDAGCACDEVVRVELGSIEPLVQMPDGQICSLSEREYPAVHEVILGGEVSGTLRDMLCAAQWFKSKRAHLEIDLVIVPATRQTLEAMVADGTLSQLLSAGARLLPPDPRLFDGEWQSLANGTNSLRSFTQTSTVHSSVLPWALASVETLCQTAISGRMQDPRLLRRSTKVTCPRELPIDDTWLFERKPSVAPPPMPAKEPKAKKDAVQDWLDASAS